MCCHKERRLLVKGCWVGNQSYTILYLASQWVRLHGQYTQNKVHIPIRTYSRYGVSIQNSYGNITIQILIDIFWISQRRTLQEVGTSWRWWPGHRIQGDQQSFSISALSCIVLFCSLVVLYHSFMTTHGLFHKLNNKRECEEIASRGVRHGTDTQEQKL